MKYFLVEIKKNTVRDIAEFQVFLFPDFLLKAYRITVSLQGRVWWSGAQSRQVVIEVVKII